MHLASYEVLIPEGTESEGYVSLRHNSQYTISLRNRADTRCDAIIKIDGEEVGAWRVNPRSQTILERPVYDTGRFTFYEVGSREAEKAGILNSEECGLVTVVFLPETTWHGYTLSASPTPIAGGTGLSGESDQNFSAASAIEHDHAQAVTIYLRLVAVPDEPRPMHRRETKIPPPVPPRGHAPSRSASRLQRDKAAPSAKVRSQSKSRTGADRLKRWQYVMILLLLLVVCSFLSASLGIKQQGAFVTVLGIVQIPLLWMRLTDAGMKGWLALVAIVPVAGWIVGIMGLILPTKPPVAA